MKRDEGSGGWKVIILFYILFVASSYLLPTEPGVEAVNADYQPIGYWDDARVYRLALGYQVELEGFAGRIVGVNPAGSCMAGDYVIIASNKGGISVVDVFGSEGLIGSAGVLGEVSSVSCSGDMALVASISGREVYLLLWSPSEGFKSYVVSPPVDLEAVKGGIENGGLASSWENTLGAAAGPIAVFGSEGIEDFRMVIYYTDGVSLRGILLLKGGVPLVYGSFMEDAFVSIPGVAYFALDTGAKETIDAIGLTERGTLILLLRPEGRLPIVIEALIGGLEEEPRLDIIRAYRVLPAAAIVYGGARSYGDAISFSIAQAGLEASYSLIKIWRPGETFVPGTGGLSFLIINSEPPTVKVLIGVESVVVEGEAYIDVEEPIEVFTPIIGALSIGYTVSKPELDRVQASFTAAVVLAPWVLLASTILGAGYWIWTPQRAKPRTEG